nr:hypothetical protein [Escherichia coli]
MKVLNNKGAVIELPNFFQNSSRRLNLMMGDFQNQKNKISKEQRAELRLKFGGRCAYCGCPLPEKKAGMPIMLNR